MTDYGPYLMLDYEDLTCGNRSLLTTLQSQSLLKFPPLHLGRRLPSGGCFRGFPIETMSLLQEIPASPFRVKVDPSHDASKVKAEGPGLSKAGKMACVQGHPEGLLQASGSGHVWSLAMRDSSPGSPFSRGRAPEAQPLTLAALVETVLMSLSDWF